MNHNSVPKNLVKSSSLPLMKISNSKKQFPLGLYIKNLPDNSNTKPLVSPELLKLQMLENKIRLLEAQKNEDNNKLLNLINQTRLNSYYNNYNYNEFNNNNIDNMNDINNMSNMNNMNNMSYMNNMNYMNNMSNMNNLNSYYQVPSYNLQNNFIPFNNIPFNNINNSNNNINNYKYINDMLKMRDIQDRYHIARNKFHLTRGVKPKHISNSVINDNYSNYSNSNISHLSKKKSHSMKKLFKDFKDDIVFQIQNENLISKKNIEEIKNFFQKKINNLEEKQRNDYEKLKLAFENRNYLNNNKYNNNDDMKNIIEQKLKDFETKNRESEFLRKSQISEKINRKIKKEMNLFHNNYNHLSYDFDNKNSPNYFSKENNYNEIYDKIAQKLLNDKKFKKALFKYYKKNKKHNNHDNNNKSQSFAIPSHKSVLNFKKIKQMSEDLKGKANVYYSDYFSIPEFKENKKIKSQKNGQIDYNNYFNNNNNEKIFY